MYNRKYTPERITELKPNEIFVFGSNLAGLHSGGAARLAFECFGAVWGQGVGLQGQSYAIPTMQGGVETIKPYVDKFTDFAKQHQEYKFLVTRIGCGIAGFKNEEIAPLFAKAYYIRNIIMPEEFVEELAKVIHLPEKWNYKRFFNIENKGTVNSKNSYVFTDMWADMPSGRFIRRGDTLIGFEPAQDNIVGSESNPYHAGCYSVTLKRLILPGEGITAIAKGVFENIEVLGEVELPCGLEKIGDYTFAKSKIGILKIYQDALKDKYGRQFKGAFIDKLYLPDSNMPMNLSEFGVLLSIASNAKVNEVFLDNSVQMSWHDFQSQ